MNQRYRLNTEMIRAYLANGDWKQSHLVKKLGLSHSYVAQMLCDQKIPSLEVMLNLSRLLGCTVEDLLIPRAKDAA